MKPKDEPIDAFDDSLAGKEIDNMSYSSLVEPKEEPLDDFQLNSAEKEIPQLSFVGEKECKKEEMDDEEFLGASYQSDNDNILLLSPVKPKMEVIEDRIIISVENPDGLQIGGDFYDKAIDYNIRRRCHHTKLDELVSSSDLSANVFDKVTPRCVLCEKFPSTPYAYAYHLTHHHKYSLITNGIYLLCSCGLKIRSHQRDPVHIKEVSIFNIGRRIQVNMLNYFTLQRTHSEMDDVILTPKCVHCETYPSNAYDYATHILVQHKSTLVAKGIYLLCSCGFKMRSQDQALYHNKKCDGHQFTIHKFEEGAVQCVMCDMRPLTVDQYADHISYVHSSTLIKNGIYLLCSCGLEVRSTYRNPYHNQCFGFDFTLHKLNSKIELERLASNLAVKCIMCENHPINVYDYASHLVLQHNTSLRTNGIYLLCSCGFEARNHIQAFDHAKECVGLQFAIRELEKGPVQCVMCKDCPLSVHQYAEHISYRHRSTLKKNGIYLRCFCGLEVRSVYRDHNHNKCNGREFTIHKLHEK